MFKTKKIPEVIIKYSRDTMDVHFNNKDWFVLHYNNIIKTHENKKYVIANRNNIDEIYTVLLKEDSHSNNQISYSLHTTPGLLSIGNDIDLINEKIGFFKSKKLSDKIKKENSKENVKIIHKVKI